MLMGIVAGITLGGIFERLIVPNDVAETAKRLRESGILFRLGIFGWFLILCLDVLVSWSLYVFFSSVHQSISLLTAWLRLIYAAILGASLLPLLNALAWSHPKYVAIFPSRMLNEQIFLSFQSSQDTWSLGLTLFGLHLWMLGYLVHKAKEIPKIIGFLLYLACLGYVVGGVGHLLYPNYSQYKSIVGMIFSIPMIFGEVGLGVWMLVRNKRYKETESR